MKKLLFCSPILILFACGNKKEISKSEENKSSGASNTELVSDSAKSINAENLNFDSINKIKETEMHEHYEIIHGAPDQQKIDSIKAAKAKEKNSNPK